MQNKVKFGMEMNNVNIAMLEGKVGMPPEVLDLEKSKVKFTVATEAEDGSTDWHTIICYKQVGAFVLRNLKKGDIARRRIL